MENVLQLLKSLPRNFHLDKLELNKAEIQKAAPAPLETLGEEDEDVGVDAKFESGGGEEEDLKIAWQYRKSVQRERLGQGPATSSTTTRLQRKKAGVAKEYCHSYDLQGNLVDQLDVMGKSSILRFSCSAIGSGSCSCGISFYLAVKAKLGSLIQERKNTGVVRLLLYRTRLSVLAVALPLLITHVRESELPVVFLVACRPWTLSDPSNTAATLRHGLRRVSDIVLEVEGFASRSEYPPPSEFRMFHGLLKICKAATITAATANGGGGHFADMTSTRQLQADLFGLKRDRRKLHIQMLHIPPEDYVEGGGSVGMAVRSGAGWPSKDAFHGGVSHGLGCATTGGGTLDF